ncbi:MAG TPA: DEAD/DEAH box helicase [Polyangiales bacterium]|nr:DEAD/DEAH box helicase [Polyangiales bacterium]
MAGSTEALYEAIREQCAKGVWLRAEQMTRTSSIDAKHTPSDEIELRLITKGGMTSPRVVLSPADLDWSCECPSEEPACIHVAAAILAVRNAQATGQPLTGLSAPLIKLSYKLRELGGSLALERFLVRGEQLAPLGTRLSAWKRRDGDDDVQASPADMAVDVALGPVVSGKIPRPLVPRVLAALTECNDVEFRAKPAKIGEPRPVIRVRVDDHPEGFRVWAEQDPEIEEIFDNGVVLHAGTLRAVGELDLSGRDVDELRKGRVYPFGQVADLVGRVIPALQERVPLTNASKLLPSATPMQPRLLVQTEFVDGALSVLPLLVYGDPPVARIDGGKLHYLGGALPVRNEERERRLQDELTERTGLEVGHTSRFMGRSALDAAEKLRRFGKLSVAGSGLDACFVAAPLTPHFELDAARTQFGFVSETEGGMLHASAEAVVEAWRRGEQLVPLIEGGFAPLPAAVLSRVGTLLADLLASKQDDDSLPACALPDLARLCEALNAPPPPSFTRLRELTGDFAGIQQAELPKDLNAQLRDYQHDGVNWLAFLSRANLGAMLADDMGLGKTLQALCVMGSPCLVVAPASVLHNWAAEIERFRPALRVHTYHGPNRELRDDADVTLTTYAILRLDDEILAARRWDTVVLDEAQNIKNADSQVARAAFSLDARFRMTLTGTPIENRLDELWSQFHFANRGLLGGRADFQERYAKPIAEGDLPTLQHLRRRIKPFMLRRLKRDVARELPPRTDVVVHCTLNERERELYDAILAATRKEVIDQLAAGGNVLAALEALLRLRQAACHVGLLPGQSADSSSKLELLLELLDKVLAEDHKALVFSQWTSLLDRVEPLLTAAGVDFLRLDGTTRDRGAVVSRFQNEPNPRVMLVSLKAGGTGLNLTAADHVFLLDPWWNPAVEDQAADRAHRIGQERPVLVHRLVAEETVEERMLTLQAKKRALAEAATHGAEAAFGLTRDDLLALLG